MIRILTILLAMASPAAAQMKQPCAPHDALAEQMTGRYGERLAHSGLTAGDNVLEIWANPDSGTWTALVLNAQNIACIVATGEFWQDWSPTPGAPL